MTKMSLKVCKMATLINGFQDPSWADPEGGGTGGPDPPPLKNHKNIGFPSNIDLDPLRFTKRQFQSSLYPIKQKTVSVGPPLTKLSGSAHAHYR